MVAVPSVLPLETGMQIEVHYVWPTQFLIDCAVGSKRLRQFLRPPGGVHLRCVGRPAKGCRSKGTAAGRPRPLERRKSCTRVRRSGAAIGAG
jgi:hypothetical protein